MLLSGWFCLGFLNFVLHRLVMFINMYVGGYLPFRCCLYNNHQAKDYIDSFVTHCVRVSVHSNYSVFMCIGALSRFAYV